MPGIPTIKLNTGALIPQVGLGTWQSADGDGYTSTVEALKAGYTHIDSAMFYRNEAEVGKAIRESGIPRDKLFVTTKIWPTDLQYVEETFNKSIELLGLDYVDLYLMHWPVAMNHNGNDRWYPTKPDGSTDIVDPEEWSYLDTYKEMQKLLKTGKVKAIGISNFNQERIEKLLADPEITVVPAVEQIELHPLLPQQELVDYCHSKGIAVEAYSPLGSTGAPILNNETIVKIAKKRDVSPAVIAISWAVWRKTIVLPKSTHAERIKANLQLVELTDEEGKEIDNIHKLLGGPKRLVDPQWGIKLFD
ncbi:unnamed protein product [Ambrosiozyma monospora]|uniref:2-dehydropantolactone reductase n=1 Tax=Ambrosiozyma monospora TaxID=43982 RepID=A0A9W6YZK7_AMBMO|nr:unnamed protein product [Ambrosiozyma monospora]